MTPASVTALDSGRRTRRAFADPTTVVQSWYVAARSREIGDRAVVSREVAGRKLTLYRGVSGDVHALDSLCPHMGVDLGHGDVVGEDLRCAMHHWCFGPDGHLTSAPAEPDGFARSVPAHSVTERWGLVWVFLGASAPFPLPEPKCRTARAFRLPPQRFACHPHLISANAFDTRHFGPLHGVDLLAEPRFTQPAPERVELTLRGRIRNPLVRRLCGGTHRDMDATMSVTGGNLSWAEVRSPVPFDALFASQPLPGGGARTHSTVFVPRGTGLRVIAIAALLVTLLRRDHELLDDLRFVRGFTDADATFRKAVEAVDRMPTV